MKSKGRVRTLETASLKSWLFFFAMLLDGFWQAHDLQVKSQIRTNWIFPPLSIYHICKSSAKRPGLLLHQAKNIKIMVTDDR